MRHETRWQRHFEALLVYEDRYGDALVPTGHGEFVGPNECINLGNWVSYMRTRYRQGKLSVDRIQRLEGVGTWTWGPVRPGPKSKNYISERNNSIYSEHKSGQTLANIGNKYSLSRQRVHQIVKEYEDE